jgi:hypothetical protein
MKRISFCEDWLFGKSGNEKEPVLLPHDATQLEERSADEPSGSGGAFYLGGCYEYTKMIDVPESWRDKAVSLLFEGVYPKAKVLLNGQEIGGCAYGYSQFEVPLTGLRYGEENEITVIADNSETPNSRWYAGAGIYRPVWLLVGGAVRILNDGIRVTTLSIDPACVRVETEHVGNANTVVEILDGETVIAGGEGDCVDLTIPDAKLWDAENPNLYTCRVRLAEDGEVLDEAETVFGIRQITWSTEGFFVNGKSIKLKGGCIHSDNGILGARCFDEAEWRRVRRLREFGFNAIRSAHNPLCRAALEACDALGMYVMDETWDMWDQHKTDYDYAGRFTENWRQDVRYMIAKDYNHPSVVLYSIGNEVTEPAKPEGVQLAADIIKEIKCFDTTRPVTGGINIMLILLASKGVTFNGGSVDGKVSSTEFNEWVAGLGKKMLEAAASPDGDEASSPVLELLDIAGYNYAQSRYEKERELHPERIVVGSETFPQDLPGNWALVTKCPWVIGDFMWTAWDYIGEVGIGDWVSDEDCQGFGKPYPWKLGGTGALDILGNETAEAGMASVIFGARTTPYIAVRPILAPGQSWYHAAWRGSNAIPSWSWRGCEGLETEVEVYSKSDLVELFLNGQSLGKAKTVDGMALFTVRYQPGELKAAAYSSDGTCTESALHSAEGEVRPVITPEEKPEIGKVLFADISLRGENGTAESNADENLRVSVTGGTLLAFGSARARTEEVFHSGEYRTYYGRSLAAVLVTGNELEIRAERENGEVCSYKAQL